VQHWFKKTSISGKEFVIKQEEEEEEEEDDGDDKYSSN
jgi:hypothetical protein